MRTASRQTAVALLMAWCLAATTYADWQPYDLAVYAGQNLSIAWQTRVGGDAGARSNITLSDQGRVDGDLYAGSSVSTGWHSKFGTVYQQLGASRFDPLTLLQPDVQPSGAAPLDVQSHDTALLLPGTYGAVSTAWHGNLALSAGTYYFDSLSLGDEGRLALDTTAGDVRVFVAGDVHLAWNTRVTRSGTGGALFAASGAFTAADDSQVDASVMVGGAVTLGWSSVVAGQVFGGGDVTLGSQADVGGAKLGTLSGTVPEPTAFMLVACGAFVLGRARWRRSRRG